MKSSVTSSGFGLAGLGGLAGARRRRSADVAVVGAGISGLVAARRIASSGRSVVVLEARPDRVGGRLESAVFADVPLDVGGACVGASHHRLNALIDQLGLSTWPAHDGGQRTTVHDWPEWGFPAQARRKVHRARIESAKRGLDALAGSIDRESPWASPNAQALDSRSLGSWLDDAADGPRASVVLRGMLTNLLCADLDSVSLLHGLFYLRSGGGLGPLLSRTGGAQQDLVVGGSHAVAAALAAGLGDSVVLGEPVRRVVQERSRVLVETDGMTVQAGAVVIALPPVLAARIAYEPGLPAGREQLMRSMRTGDSIKVVAVYDDAFWRHDGRDGEAWGTALPFSFTHDVSCADGEPGVLSVFFSGARAAAVRPLAPAERRELVLDTLETCFGPHAAHPVGYVERDWSADEWSLGGYGSAMPLGGWTSCGAALRQPAGRIHWAGTETASEHHGYIEGAVQAGQRAAAEALHATEVSTAVA